MKNTFRIWLLAILYQTVIFPFTFGMMINAEAYMFLFLIGFVGGIPGLFLFGAVMHHLHLSQSSPRIKWGYAIGGAIIAAIATTLLTALFLGLMLKQLLNAEIGLLYPTPLSALLSLFTFYTSVNKYFNENTIKKIS
jgi:NADH:ubiquinone oxidoreductase subunit 6 (subunit J)